MRVAAFICYIVAFGAEVTGAVGIVLAAVAARRALARGPAAGLDTDGMPYVGDTFGDDTPLRSVALPWWSIGLVFLGITAGFAGNLLTL